MSWFPDLATVVNFGPLSIRWYAVCICAGIFLAYYLSLAEWKKAGYKEDPFLDFLLVLVIVGTLGCRIWYVLFVDFKHYMADPISILRIMDGGLAIQGGLMSGALYILYYSFRHKLSFLRMADMIAPNVLLAQALGRWGNFFNQEAYGEIVPESYYNLFPGFIKKVMYIDGAYRQPMFLIECALCILGWVLITQVYKRFFKPKRGYLSGAYLLWYGIIRFGIEHYRSDSLMIGSFKTAQLVSIFFVFLSLFFFSGLVLKLFKVKPVILFDFDQTLGDTRALIIDSYKAVLKKYRPKKKMSKEEQIEVLGPPLSELFPKYLPDQNPEQMIVEYREYLDQHHDELIKEMPHALEVVKALSEKGYKLGVVSSKLHVAVERDVNFLGMGDYVKAIIGMDDITSIKPDPEGLWQACEALKASHDSVIYVGDSFTDVRAGVNANAFTVAYGSVEEKIEDLKAANPNRLITDLRELLDLVKEDLVWTNNSM
ncbi:MAG: prolipoprotein diacylglyceryl transferase [Erysipelotrichaceae bacterium]|jgi:phosphatidylglycerol:prolipoprotein diacylglycerol transferase|nr:prolipoprotein diacylglyceryl transferase [Erysipelotrichaceae bacterium]